MELKLKPCRSERNYLKYVSKEDKSPYFNCPINRLSFQLLQNSNLATRLLLSIKTSGVTYKSYVIRSWNKEAEKLRFFWKLKKLDTVGNLTLWNDRIPAKSKKVSIYVVNLVRQNNDGGSITRKDP